MEDTESGKRVNDKERVRSGERKCGEAGEEESVRG